MKRLIVLLLPLMLCGNLHAQSPVQTDAQATGMMRRNTVTVSPLPLFSGTGLISYEHVFPFRSALEVEFGAQGLNWERWRGATWNWHTRPGCAAAVGYKFYFPIDDEDLPMLESGNLIKLSWYLKMRLAYVYQWSSYDVYTGNRGWEILTERHTYHENDLSVALIVGFQYVGQQGFVLTPFIGYNLPVLVAGPFHTMDEPGISAFYAGYLTCGMKLGWAF